MRHHKIGTGPAGGVRNVTRSVCPLLPLSTQVRVAMSRPQHWHEGSRADYITSLALARSNAESHGRLFTSHSHPFHRHDNTRTSTHVPKRLQPSAIPDLRFEPTYLAKLEVADPGWKSVAWITIRENAISPLLQGVIWCVAFKAQLFFIY
jgi:autophagy-related ATG43-like protein